MSKILVRQKLPYAVLIVCGVISLFSYYFDVAVISSAASTGRSWVVVVTAFATLLGASNIFRTHSVYTMRKGENWMFSVWLLIVFSLMVIVGLGTGTGSSSYKWLYGALYIPLAQSVVGTLGLFLVSASYRAFRIRNRESLIFFLGAFVIAVRQASIGPLLWPGFEVIGDWMALWPTTGTMRAISIGLAIGGVAVMLRTMLTWEKIGLEEEEAE